MKEMYYLETKKLLVKIAPIFSNQQLLSDYKEFNPENFRFFTSVQYFRGWHLKIFGALGILL